MNNLSTALWITGIGMGLVFGAIIVLWLMMILLTALTADASSPLSAKSASDSAEADSVSSNDIFAKAAAIGVAMAMAEQRLSSAHPLPEPPTAIVSAWQLGMRTRQMSEKGYRLPKS